MKKIIFFCFFIAAVLIGFLVADHFYTIPVWMYHRIMDSPDEDSLIVSRKRFEEQMRYLYSHGYTVLDPYTYEGEFQKKNMRLRKAVLLTFDDGFEDNYINAYPILREYGFSGLFFVPASKVDSEGRLKAHQVREMVAQGMYIGSHTYSECYLPDLSEYEMQQELRRSKEQLEYISGMPVDFFAYCIGGFTLGAERILEACGYKAAFTTNRSFKHRWQKDDIYAIRRIKITEKDRGIILKIKASGLYHLTRRVRNPF